MLGLKPNNTESLKTILLIWTLMVLLVLLVIQMLMMAFGINQVRASEHSKTALTSQQVKQMALSFEGKQQGLSEQIRTDVLISNKQQLQQNPFIAPLSGLTREQMHAKKREEYNRQQEASALNTSEFTLNSASVITMADYSLFEIFDAWATLYDDYDYDGFYQSFSVVFDADYYGDREHAEVYADLYLSQDGGPWFHFYSTDVFRIYGNSETDSYEVLTTLYENYPEDYYDVLIDLYEPGFPGIVATMSSDDTDALYALPLESSDYDEYYDDYDDDYHHHDDHHGSLSYLLGLLGSGFLYRRFKRVKK